jgi:hypothetical protein
VLLGASLCMLVLVSAFVAFGSWPGESSGRQVDQVLLNEVVSAKPKAVAVRSDAVKAARRSDTRRQIAQATRQRRAGGGRTAGGKQVAKAPHGTATPTTPAGTPVAAAPGGSGGGAVNTVRQQTQDATQGVQQKLDTTTNQVTSGVQNTVDQTTTQVNQVVDQVVGDVQQQAATTGQQVQDTVTNTTDAVQNAAGGVLGH